MAEAGPNDQVPRLNDVTDLPDHNDDELVILHKEWAEGYTPHSTEPEDDGEL